MTDTKWRSPNRHSIASDVTDKLPPYTHPENVHTETPNYIHIGDDLLSRIEKMLLVTKMVLMRGNKRRKPLIWNCVEQFLNSLRTGR